MFNLELYADALDHQVEQKRLSPKTRDYYVDNLQRLEQRCAEMEGASAGILEKAVLQLCRDTKQIPKYVAAIKKYERDVLGSPGLLLYGEPLMRLRAARPVAVQGKQLKHSERTYAHKINALPNRKLKLAFRLQGQSGLRVNEIAELRKDDIAFQEGGSIQVTVRSGKGRKQRCVNVVEDTYLYDHLRQLVESVGERDRLFYSASYLIKKAGEYQMETHDLRRINARQRFRDNKKKGVSRYQARKAVAAELGHSDTKETVLYLGEEWTGGEKLDGDEG